MFTSMAKFGEVAETFHLTTETSFSMAYPSVSVPVHLNHFGKKVICPNVPALSNQYSPFPEGLDRELIVGSYFLVLTDPISCWVIPKKSPEKSDCRKIF